MIGFIEERVCDCESSFLSDDNEIIILPMQTSWVFLTMEKNAEVFSLLKLLSLANWSV